MHNVPCESNAVDEAILTRSRQKLKLVAEVLNEEQPLTSQNRIDVALLADIVSHGIFKLSNGAIGEESAVINSITNTAESIISDPVVNQLMAISTEDLFERGRRDAESGKSAIGEAVVDENLGEEEDRNVNHEMYVAGMK